MFSQSAGNGLFSLSFTPAMRTANDESDKVMIMQDDLQSAGGRCVGGARC